jgi:hypothetical protein
MFFLLSGSSDMSSGWIAVAVCVTYIGKTISCSMVGKKEVKKLKITLVQALRLCTGPTAHKGSRSIALPFHDHGTRRD